MSQDDIVHRMPNVVGDDGFTVVDETPCCGRSGRGLTLTYHPELVTCTGSDMTERVRIEQSEEFPVYYLAPDDTLASGRVLDLPDGFAERFRAAAAEYAACQEILDKAWRSQGL